jgi:hypothetical protein
MTMRIMVTVVLVFATLAPAKARAEAVRHGFLVGGSLGGGGASACRDCEGVSGPIAELHLGGWLTPTWALAYEAWVFTDLAGSQSFEPAGLGMGLVTVTRHMGERTWVKSGLGFAEYQRSDALSGGLLGEDDSARYPGLGLGAAAGYELYQSDGSIVIDLSSRLGAGILPGHGASVAGALAVGLNWN